MRQIPLLRASRLLLNHNRYYLLDHHKMEQIKTKIFAGNNKSILLKIKFIWKQTIYTLVQGSKDLWADCKWIIKLYKTKPRSQFTGYQLSESSRIVQDILKFVPYSVMIVVPFAQLLLPVLLWVFPNAIPSFFLFDTAWDKGKQRLEHLQEESHRVLLERLLRVLRQLSKREEEFTDYDGFKTDFFEIIDELNEKLDYRNFSSDQLIEVLKFLGGDYITGTRTINKVVNLFTMAIPRLIVKILRLLYSKILGKQLQPYKDPFFIKGDFRIFEFNYFPFEFFKRKLLLYQISRKFRILKEQDIAFEKYGMDDIGGNSIKDFARERGFAALSCYITLKNVLKNDWVKITTHPKFEDNNIKVWYSVMMYNFLAQTNKDLN